MGGTNKALGQHWLNNRVILDEIADLARGKDNERSASTSSENRGEVCVEIGAGLGTLTASLLKRFKKVIAIEYDDRLATNLPKSFPGTNLEVVNDDILEYDFSRIKEPYVVAGNIPYYITSPIIEKVLTIKNLPERIVLLIQKEVAERILAKKETKLSLFVKNRARAYPGLMVPKTEFTPPPKVDSEVIVLEPFSKPRFGEEVFRLIRVGFREPRKKLIHNLAGIKPKKELERIFDELEIDVNMRPGDLSLENWWEVAKKINEKI